MTTSIAHVNLFLILQMGDWLAILAVPVFLLLVIFIDICPLTRFMVL